MIYSIVYADNSRGLTPLMHKTTKTKNTGKRCRSTRGVRICGPFQSPIIVNNLGVGPVGLPQWRYRPALVNGRFEWSKNTLNSLDTFSVFKKNLKIF